MPRAEFKLITFPRQNSFIREFEELPLYSEKAANGDVFFAGLVDGVVEISYASDGAWHISNITIKVDNGRRVRDGGVTKAVHIDADENPSLYWHLLDVLTDKYATTISEWVAFEMAEAA
jgi:hypothetical protein